MSENLKYSVLILTKNEADNIRSLIPQVKSVLSGLGLSFEIVLIDASSKDGTKELAESLGAKAYTQIGKSYGDAFREGIAACSGEWILALDADHSHPPSFLRSMVSNHEGTDLLIASRYIPGGDANMEFYRNILSRILSVLFGHCLGIPVKDVSSGFRVYRRSAVAQLDLKARDFDVLIEALVKLTSRGFKVREIPFIYEPRVFGSSNARLFKFAVSYLRTLKGMWNLRNSGDAADYEERAYKSLIPLQAFWQKKRVKSVLALADRNALTLDIGCGSSRTVRSLPNSIAIDLNLAPLRYLKSNGILTVQADLHALPFPSKCTKQVILSNVIQHLDKENFNLSEISRVLDQGGKLIIATPDYSNSLWQFLDRIHSLILPRAPASQIKSRYTKAELIELLIKSGFKIEAEADIWKAEVAVSAVKS
jgi:dolichol-phosphate mannosyltransferase